MHFSKNFVLYTMTAVADRVVIPLGMDSSGLSFVNATIPSIHRDAVIPMTITPYSSAGSLYVIEGRGWNSLWMENVSVHIQNVTSIHNRFLVSYVEDVDIAQLGSFADLGIGRNSPLVREYGSVDYIKDIVGNANLVINSTMDWFLTEACANDSLVTIPVFSNPAGTELVNIRVGLGSFAVEELEFILSPSPYLLSLPAIALDDVFEILEAENDMTDNPDLSFRNCAETLNRLPNLNLILADQMIVLTPSDYTRDAGNDTCDLLVRAAPSSGRHVINPFLFPDMNVKFTNSDVFICDSIVTNETDV